MKKICVKTNFTNGWLYSLAILGVLLIVGVGVYALSPGVKPNPGHLISEVAPPSGCIGGQFLKWDGSVWTCVPGALWSSSDSNIYYNSGNVGIGTTGPGYKLDVAGTIRAKDVFSAGGKNLIIGDDTYLTDIDVANTLGIYGMQNKDRAGIRLGSDGSLIFGDNGNIGIGTTSPTEKLDVNGNVKVSGNIRTNKIETNQVDLSMGTSLPACNSGNVGLMYMTGAYLHEDSKLYICLRNWHILGGYYSYDWKLIAAP